MPAADAPAAEVVEVPGAASEAEDEAPVCRADTVDAPPSSDDAMSVLFGEARENDTLSDAIVALWMMSEEEVKLVESDVADEIGSSVRGWELPGEKTVCAVLDSNCPPLANGDVVASCVN